MIEFTSEDLYRSRTNLNYLTLLMIFSFLLFQGMLSPNLLFAGTDKLDFAGCHHNAKDKIYECHQGPFRGRIFANREDVQKALEEINHPEKVLSAKVLSVTDGDAILVLFLRSGDIREVRLAEIDSPEKGQQFGKAARLLILKMVFGKLIRVNVKKIDPAGRIFADVILSEGRSLNRELVRKGLSWWDSEISDDTSIAALEAIARSERIGLWQLANPVPPWEFRKNGRPSPQRRHIHCDKICT